MPKVSKHSRVHTMTALSSLFKLFTLRQAITKPVVALSCPSTPLKRAFADKSKPDINKSKHVVVQGTESEERVRVRRARPADVPRVLRFVREHASAAWPGLIAPPSSSHLVLCDYVARALAQGHTMLAEQQETRRGWSQIRGIALGLSVCPWDATILERWARCIRCSRSRRLMHFTAHCLRAPRLHDKYNVHNILQVILIVPPECPKSVEMVRVLAKNAIQRGRDEGFPVLRFDVTDSVIANALEQLKLKKEWQFSYDVLPDDLKERDSERDSKLSAQSTEADTVSKNEVKDSKSPKTLLDVNYIAVYTAVTNKNKSKPKRLQKHK